VVGTDRAVQCAVSDMSNQEVKSDVSEPDCEAEVLMEDQQQSVTVTEDTSLIAVDHSSESADQNSEPADNEGLAASLADASSIAADTDSIQQESVLSLEPDPSVQVEDAPVSQLTTPTSASTDSASAQPLQVLSTVSSAVQASSVSVTTKSPAFVLCQVTGGGQRILVPRSAVSGIQLSSGTLAGSATSISPVFRSAAMPLQTVSSSVQGVAVTSPSSGAPAVAGVQTSAGIRLLRQAADGVRVITGTSTAAIRPSLGITLNRVTTPQRLALAIAPANSAVRPAGTGSIRLVAIRSGTPVAIGGVSAGGSAVASPQIKLLTPLSGVRPLTSLSTGTTASSVPASTSTVSAVRQQTAVSDVQAYLRRIEELKSAQPDQGAKTPLTLAATVRTPLKAKTSLPTTLTSAQQIVVLQSGSQPQLANISASQLVSIFVASCFSCPLRSVALYYSL